MKVRYSLFIILFSILCLSLAACDQSRNQSAQSRPLRIGIVLPLEHQAMHDIVQGFKAELKNENMTQVDIRVENAQNDLNLQRAILQKMQDNQYDIVIPIGTVASQMALKVNRDAKIVSLASNISEKERRALKQCRVAVVHDEISGKQLLQTVQKAYPTIKTIVLMHSASEKVLPEVKEAIQAGRALGITVKPRMVMSLAELYTSARALSSDVQGILVLKDHLIVSGMSGLATIAREKHIPLIASDQGSVESGATMAVGVSEAQIGIEGAKLVSAIAEQGQDPCSLPIVDMTTLSLFIGTRDRAEQAHLKQVAAELHYRLFDMTAKHDADRQAFTAATKTDIRKASH